MFEAKNNLLPKHLQDLFNRNREREKWYNLRNSDFTLPRSNTLLSTGNILWNILGLFCVQVDKEGTWYG